MLRSSSSKSCTTVETFDRCWREAGSVPDWDYLCEEVYQALRQTLRPVFGLRVLEVGCGTGRISAQLAADGANVCMLDASLAGLRLTLSQLQRKSVNAEVVAGDMVSLPFNAESFDVVWSAGVLEHYHDEDLVRALREMRRVVIPGGYVISMVPNALALAYRVAIWNGQRKGSWIDQLERCFRTLHRQTQAAGLRVEREWAIAPRESEAFFFAHASVHGLRRLCRGGLAVLRWTGLGNYLLVNVSRRRS